VQEVEPVPPEPIAESDISPEPAAGYSTLVIFETV
jgi:hypothetical protein